MKSNQHARSTAASRPAARSRLRLAPLADVMHVTALGGLGAFLLLGLLACAEGSRNPRASVGTPARLANNGTDAREADHPAVVRVEAFGSLCTGSIVSATGHVLTAGHCLMDSALRDVLAPSSVVVRVNGMSVRATSVAVPERFSSTKDSHHDIGVVVIPMGAGAPAPLPFAGATPARGEAVTMIGFGVPTPDDDLDVDGVRNDLDHCPSTPSFLSRSVETSGERAGCEKGETAGSLPGTGTLRSPATSGVLRKGTNVISGIDFAGGLRVLGPFTTSAREGQVTPAFGDSGGPLLDAAGRIVGTVQGGNPAPSGTRAPTNDAFFVDVNAEGNKAFLGKNGVAW